MGPAAKSRFFVYAQGSSFRIAPYHLENVVAAIRRPVKSMLLIGGVEEELMLDVLLGNMRRAFKARISTRDSIIRSGRNKNDVEL